jgi:pyridoxine kinase
MEEIAAAAAEPPPPLPSPPPSNNADTAATTAESADSKKGAEKCASIDPLPTERRILSVQSHVVSGYVGNKAAVFPLQLLGYDVDFINTVEFSNHTGYPEFAGSRMNGEQLDALRECLQENRLLRYDCILTGYIGKVTLVLHECIWIRLARGCAGSASFLASVVALVDAIRSNNCDVKYTCDPVLGDDGKYYVPENLVPIFAEKIIPLAYMITPNQFEAELLSGVKIDSHETAIQALLEMHRKGPSVVVITSCEFPSGMDSLTGTLVGAPYLNCYVLEVDDAAAASKKLSVTRIVIEKLPGHFTGTGDTTAALMTAWMNRLGTGNAGEALARTLSTMHAIISRTIAVQHFRKNQPESFEDSLRAVAPKQVAAASAK